MSSEPQGNLGPPPDDEGLVNASRAVKTLAPEPLALAETDHLRYQLLRSEIYAAELRVQMYQRELQHAQVAQMKAGHEAALHLKALATKYGVDFEQHTVSEDGFILPRSQPVPIRRA